MSHNEKFPDYMKMSEWEIFQKLISINNKFLTHSICTTCYKKVLYDYCPDCKANCQIKCNKSGCDKCIKKCFYKCSSKSCTYCDGGKILLNETRDIKHLQRIFDLLTFDYSLTYDNFIKMILIYMRA